MTEADVDAAAELTARAFAGPGEYDAMFAISRAANLSCPFMPPELCWVVEEEGRIVCKWQALDFEVRVGRTPVRMVGAQGLVAERGANGKGYPAAIIQAALPTVIERGFDIMLGFAQRGGLYRRLGAAPVMAEYEMRLDANRIPRIGTDPFRPLEEADVPRMIDLYEESNAECSGTLLRTPDHWPWMVRRAPDTVICDDGYVGYRLNEDSLEIREIGGRGPGFYDLALRKVATLARDLGQRRIISGISLDHPAARMATGYGAVFEIDYPKKSGAMAAVVAVGPFLEKLRPELSERISGSALRDLRVDLTVQSLGQTAHLTLNEGGSKVHKLDLSLPAGALLQLAFGYRDARSVLLQGLTPGGIEIAIRRQTGQSGREAGPGEARAKQEEGGGLALDDVSWRLLDVLFPQQHPFMWFTDRF